MSLPNRSLALIAVIALVCTVAEGATLRTNWAKALVPLDEIIPGGPPPDGIPAIDRPNFVAPADAAAWLKPKEPVLAPASSVSKASATARRTMSCRRRLSSIPSPADSSAES